jgi:site-specific recombinase XerD
MARAMPPYIIKQRQTCYARVTIPEPLRVIFGGKKEFKASTGLADPWRAAAKAAPWITDWFDRIEQARTAGLDPADAKVMALTNAYAPYHAAAALDAPGRVVVRNILLAMVDNPRQLWKALGTEPDARLTVAHAKRAELDQVTRHATPFLAHFKLWQEKTPRKGETLRMYVRDINEFAGIVTASLETLDQTHVYTWIEAMAAAGNIPKTITRKLTALNAYWRWLIRQKLVTGDRHPFTGLEIDDPRSGAEKKLTARLRWPVTVVPTLWRDAEAEGRTMLAQLIRIGAHTGGRIESLATLRVDSVQVDPDTNVRFLQYHDKTEAGVRAVPVHSAIDGLITDLVANAGPDGWLFPINLNAKRKGNAAGLEFGRFKKRHSHTDPRLVFHSLRHTISHMLEIAGCPLGVAKDIVGHVKTDMTFGLYSGETPLDFRRMWLEKAVKYPG